MLPTKELEKNGGKEVRLILSVIAVAWITTTIISSYANYKLAKVSKELAELQIAKLRAEGIKK